MGGAQRNPWPAPPPHGDAWRRTRPPGGRRFETLAVRLWATALRRLALCSLRAMLAFRHGQKPEDDDLPKSPDPYPVGARPKLATVPVLVEPTRRKAL